MRKLDNCNGRMVWSRRGVYFFSDPEEPREDGTPRIVRVGTHAVSKGSRTTLWNRLRQHRGTLGGGHPGGGNHRGSVFREIVGEAMIARDNLHCPTWGEGHTATREVRDQEYSVESRVSEYVRRLSLLWLAVDDAPGRESRRAFVERNSIAILSNFASASPIDPASKDWLGHSSPRQRVVGSGLWNSEFVDGDTDPGWVGVLERFVTEM